MSQELVITARERDIGGMSVRRLLPYVSRQMVGPFIFFDHMGPAEFEVGRGINVRPHPHINLATVTYLFEGAIEHRDSLGTLQLIRPGAINWMVAGRGVVHSERVPQNLDSQEPRLNGIQLWVALPEEFEEVEPQFSHHPKESLPEFCLEGVRIKLLLGSAYGETSPVPVFSPMCYFEAHLEKGQELQLPKEYSESAIYLVEGAAEIDDLKIEKCSMAISNSGDALTVRALSALHLVGVAGEPVGPRHIFWNFVSSSKDRIEEAKQQWREGPYGMRFQSVSGDDLEFIPLPEEPGRNPKGTIM